MSVRIWGVSGPGRPGWLPTPAPLRSGLAHHARTRFLSYDFAGGALGSGGLGVRGALGSGGLGVRPSFNLNNDQKCG